MGKAQFKMAQHGKPCLDYTPFEPMKVCDHEKGLDCLGKSKGKYGAVCACYGTFVYDTVSYTTHVTHPQIVP